MYIIIYEKRTEKARCRTPNGCPGANLWQLYLFSRPTTLYVYVCICVCIYIYIYIYTHTYVCIYIYIYIHMYTVIHIYIYIYIYSFHLYIEREMCSLFAIRERHTRQGASLREVTMYVGN